MRPVRSSTNSLQLAGRWAGSPLMARMTAQLTRSLTSGLTSRGLGNSFRCLRSQHSSGPTLPNGVSAVSSV